MDESDHGFSFAELVVVVAILGALLSVAALALRTVTERGTETACDQERRVVSIAVESYFANHRSDRLPSLPPSDGDEFERGLVSAEVIRGVSTFYDVAADGSLVPASGSPCV